MQQQCTCTKKVSNLSFLNLRWRFVVAPNNVSQLHVTCSLFRHLYLGMSHSAKWTCYPLRFLAGDAVRDARALKMCSITRRKATSVLLPPGCSSPSCSSSGTFGESTSCFSRSTPGYKSPGYIGVPGCCLQSNSSPGASSRQSTSSQYQNSYLDLVVWYCICQLNKNISKYWDGNTI